MKKSGNRTNFWKKIRKKIIITHKWEVNHPCCEEIWRFYENPEKSGKKSGNRMNFRKGKLSNHIWEVNHTFCEKSLKILWKSGKIRKIIRKPDKLPEKKIIISYMRSKLSTYSVNKWERAISPTVLHVLLSKSRMY